MAITMNDIARAAGVSKTAVSFALNNKSGISEETRQIILDVAKQLGYKPKEQSQISKPENTSNLILFLNCSKSKLTAPMTPILSELMNSIEHEINKMGHNLLFKTVKANENFKDDILKVTSQNAVKGIILSAADIGEDDISIVYNLGHPVMVIERIVEQLNIDCIMSDNYYGGYLAASYLIGLGHKNIGYIQSTVHTHNFMKRYEGFLAAIKKTGMGFQEYQLYIAPTTIEEVEVALKEKFKKSRKLPTAFFAENDNLAIGAINSLKNIGLSVPGDVSVIGYDNARLTSLYSSPSLTTIGIPVKEYAQTAVRRLLERIDTPGLVPCKYTLGIELVKRDSCATPSTKKEFVPTAD